jgi:hypothetical protein
VHSCVPPFWIGDRQFTAEDLTLIETIVREFKQLSRYELAATACENLPWKAPNGRLKINGCRLLLSSSVWYPPLVWKETPVYEQVTEPIYEWKKVKFEKEKVDVKVKPRVRLVE